MTAPHSPLGKRHPLAYYFLYLLPKNAFSRLCGMIAERPLPSWLLLPMIRGFVAAFKIDMSEAAEPMAAFPTFNAFFTRQLKPEARPIPTDSSIIISPVDGAVGQFGTLTQGRLVQAKGLDYSIADLLDDPTKAQEYLGGHYITLYLAPYNYHRIHSPVSGSIRKCTHVPGQLWTVSPLGVNYVTDLFPRNERILSYIETPQGECVVIKVGATVVGKVKLAYHSLETNLFGAKRREVVLPQAHAINKGEELGVFQLGSTVICCFKPGFLQWHELSVGQSVRLGDPIGHLQEARPSQNSD